MSVIQRVRIMGLQFDERRPAAALIYIQHWGRGAATRVTLGRLVPSQPTMYRESGKASLERDLGGP